ncbi:MAG TPA: CoA transferase [Candidatus Binataceae bacterium]|nr:CoA transferase [Candidatus Binataceae bacterium]
MAPGKPKHLLTGVKALDFTQFVAGPTVTRLMAEMGAEVIKVEFAPGGDRCRSVPYVKNERSGYFVQQNRGKQSLCLDIKHPESIEILRGIIPKVDVVVENFAPGVIARMGFDYATVKQLNPSIIMCSVSTFGQTGPLSKYAGYDFVGQAYAGVTSLSGEEGGAFYPPMLALGDVSTGVHALAAVACALFYRDRSGEGQFIDISLLDSYFGYHDHAVEVISVSGGKQKPVRTGLQYPGLSPAGMFKGQSTYIWIMAWLDHHWVKFCELMGHPELGCDPRYLDVPARVTNRDEITKIIETWLASLPSDETAVAMLNEAHIPNAPILTVEQAMNHPHLRERGTVRTVHDRLLGEFQIPGMPLRFSGFPDDLELEAPLLGEHNRRVLTDYLGYDPRRIASLEHGGVLQSAPR